jgi:hypothetical protein
MPFPRVSRWEFVTSNSGGLTVGFIGGEGGSVTLKEPGTKREIKFIYGALGACVGVGVKLPKLGRVTLPGVSGSSELFTSGGLVTMSPFFTGSKLRADDIEGGCSFVEIGGGAAWGGAGYALTFGMNTAALHADYQHQPRWCLECNISGDRSPPTAAVLPSSDP